MTEKDTTPKKKRRKQQRDKAELHPLLSSFGTDAEPVELEDDANLQQTELGGAQPVDVIVFRTEPREYSGPPHQYLETFDTPPTLKLLRDRFGGGKYLIRVHKDGRYQKGAAVVVIAGPPKTAPVETPEKETLPADGGTGDRVSDIVLGVVERMRSEIVEALSADRDGAQPKSTGLNANELSELIDMANRKRIETQLLASVLPNPEPAAAPAAAPTSALSDVLKLGLEIFRAGAEYGPKESEGSGGMLALLEPLLQKLLTPAAPVVKGVPVTGDIPRPGEIVEPVDVEAQRRSVETESANARKSAMVQNLKEAVRVMLTAIEAEVEYTDAQICYFIERKISEAEIALLGSDLTFENVHALMADEPGEQIVLDEYKDCVTRILRLLQGQDGDAGE